MFLVALGAHVAGLKWCDAAHQRPQQLVLVVLYWRRIVDQTVWGVLRTPFFVRFVMEV